MNLIARYSIIVTIAVGIISCSPKKENVVENTEKVVIEGNYVNADYKDKDKGYDWIAVMVKEYTDSLIQVSVRSRADKKKPTCTFDAKAIKQDSTGFYKSMVEGNSVLFLFAGDSLVIKSDLESGYSNLNYFCSGGASIEGVYIQSVGSGSYGSVIGYSVNNGKSMSQIAPLPEIPENPEASAGYMGHDEFAIVENTFIQRFPVYKPSDVNAKPTGGMRQLQYKLQDGEAMRKFVVDRIVEY